MSLLIYIHEVDTSQLPHKVIMIWSNNALPDYSIRIPKCSEGHVPSINLAVRHTVTHSNFCAKCCGRVLLQTYKLPWQDFGEKL